MGSKEMSEVFRNIVTVLQASSLWKKNAKLQQNSFEELDSVLFYNFNLLSSVNDL